MSKRPDLILYTSTLSARTQFILPNQDHINSLPFDGFAINIPQGWSAFQAGTRFTTAEIRTWLNPLRAFSEGRDDWLTIYVDDPGDVFDDAAWANVIHNWTLLAREAKRMGLEGILFDNEEYFDRWQNWPEGYSDAEIARGLEAYQDQTALRGRQIAEAVAAEWADAKIMFCHGPYVGAPYPNDRLPNQWGAPEDNALYGPLFTGMVEGAGPGMRIVDGGELYALRSLQQFRDFHDFRANDLPGEITWDVDPDVLANWDARVDQSVMLYTQEYPPGMELTPRTLVPALLNAFDTADGTVYLFSENDPAFDWLTPGSLPPGWIWSVTRAIRLADNTRLGTSGDDTLTGTDRIERLISGQGNDAIEGGNGADWLVGGKGRDWLRGDAGNDDVFGGAGNDRMVGGAGNDRMAGGAGADTFVLQPGGGRDVVTDFDPARDRVDVMGGTARVWVGDEGVTVRLGDAALYLAGAGTADILLV